MFIISVKEGRMLVIMNDLNCGVRDVAFEAKVFNRYVTYDYITKSLKDLSYVYLHYGLLNKVIMITITLGVNSPHIEIHEHLLQKACM
jgi:hypothetical protein